MTALPEQMHYIAMEAPGGPEVLVIAPGPVPRPATGEVLIRVAAAGINRPDILQRTGNYPPPARRFADPRPRSLRNRRRARRGGDRMA